MPKFRARIPFHGSNRSCLGKSCNILRSSAPPILSFFLCEAPRSPLVPGEGAAALHTAPRRLRPGGLSAAGTALGEKVWEPRLLGHGGPGRVLSLSLCPHLSWTQLGLGSEGYGEQEGELT